MYIIDKKQYEIIQSIAELFEISINKIMRKIFENKKFENTIFKLINDDYSQIGMLNNIKKT